MDASLSENPTEATSAEPAVPPAINAARQRVVVKAPVDRVYAQWSRIEDLPRFITSLRNVRRIDDTHFSYTWHRNGDEQQGILHIVLQISGRRIAWRTLSTGFASGVVSFEPCSQQETEVTLKIRSIFDSPSLSRRVEEYLGNFKRLVESEEAAR
jgi:uncharacterized membrane protein